MKITALKYQRNGISGEPFYHCAYENKEGKFLATFTSDENDTLVNTTNCRAVCLDKLDEAWRGDRIANELQQELKIQSQVNGVNTIYDLSKKI